MSHFLIRRLNSYKPRLLLFYIINPLSVTLSSLNIHSTVIRIFLYCYIQTLLYYTFLFWNNSWYKELRKIYFIHVYKIWIDYIFSNIRFSIPHKFLKLWWNAPNKINCWTDTDSLSSTLSFPFWTQIEFAPYFIKTLKIWYLIITTYVLFHIANLDLKTLL